MADLLFDTPWWLPVLIISVGAFVFVSGNRRQNTSTRNAGAGILLLAVLIILLSVFVDTPKKIARRESQQLVQAAVDADWTKFQSLLDPDVTLRMLASAPLYANAKELTAGAKAGTERVHLRTAHIRSMKVVETEGLVTVTMLLLTEQDDPAAPMIDSSWQFDFQNTAGTWRVHEVRALEIGQMGADQAEEFMPRVAK